MYLHINVFVLTYIYTYICVYVYRKEGRRNDERKKERKKERKNAKLKLPSVYPHIRTDPNTRDPIVVDDLAPNLALRGMIERLLKKHADAGLTKR